MVLSAMHNLGVDGNNIQFELQAMKILSPFGAIFLSKFAIAVVLFLVGFVGGHLKFKATLYI